MATVFEPIRPVPPMTTIFIVYPPFSTTGDPQMRIHKREKIRTSTRESANPHKDKHRRVRAEHPAHRAKPKQTRISRDLFPREVLREPGFSVLGIRCVH